MGTPRYLDAVLVRRLQTAAFALAVSVFVFGDALAKIPEPENILYGLAGIPGRVLSAADSGVVIVARNGGDDIASYQMGQNTQAGNYYVLRIPIDSLQPRTPLSTQEGDIVTVLMIENSTETVLGSYTVSGKGAVIQLNFGVGSDNDGDGIEDGIDPDDDNDGMPDTFELQFNFDPLNAADAAQDADGDGFTNLQEYQGSSDPRDANSVPGSDRPGWLPAVLKELLLQD